MEDLVGRTKDNLERTIDRIDSQSFFEEPRSVTVKNVVQPKRTVIEAELALISNSENYNMSHPNRGIAVVFNHEKFEKVTKLDKRTGTEKDCKDIKNTLKMFGFDVHVCQDYTRNQVGIKLEEISKMDHSDNDCLVIVVMSHGEPDKLYAKDFGYPLKDLWERFVGDRCPSLIGKPKLIFLQACRGTMTDAGVNARLCYDAADAGAMSGPVIFSIPTMADLLVMYATYEGHFAWRNPENGTWFIQALCKELRGSPHKSLAKLLLNVTRQVAFQYESVVNGDAEKDGKKQLPCTVSMLTKSLYFFKKGQVPMESLKRQ